MDARELPPDVRRTATTLAAETGAPLDRTSFVKELLAGLDYWYQRFLRDDAEVLKAWEGLNVTLGNRVTVSGTGTRLEGLACGVDAEGRLIVELDDGRRQQVAAGDVTIVKTEGPGSGSKGSG
jgi:BirA family biotin operon repressor/biotin-[acetyl-CoA-carboxylase] ligase